MTAPCLVQSYPIILPDSRQARRRARNILGVFDIDKPVKGAAMDLLDSCRRRRVNLPRSRGLGMATGQKVKDKLFKYWVRLLGSGKGSQD
jgi:hypothetical protein